MKNYFFEISEDLREKTDEELVALALKDPQVYASIMERYEEKLLRYIMRISVNSKEDAEDVLQDVFLSAYKNLNDFDQDLKFSSWIYRIAHNKVISHFRKVSARPRVMTYEGDSNILNILASNEDIARDLDKKFTARSL